MKYTLGLDVGTNSLGWTILKLDEQNEPVSIEKMGVRIFSDGRNPKDQTTLAASRRQKRHERRRRDRLIQRKKVVINQLVKMELFPQNKPEQQELKKLDVLTLRANAANEPIAAFELGRVLYYLNLKRGFKSNRKGGSEEDKANKISERIENLKTQLQENNFKTVGQFLNDRYKKGLSTKAVIENGFHLQRQLIEAEYDTIVNVQKRKHTHITDTDWQILKDKIFHQRPLKSVETGPCALFGQDGKSFRTYKYMPSFEEYRFLTELYNLSYLDLDNDYNSQSLTPEQIFTVFNELKNTKEAAYKKIRKLLKLPATLEFSIEKSKSKDKIKISTANHFFSDKLLFGSNWNKLSLSVKDQIAEVYFSEEPVEEIKNKLINLKLTELDEETLQNIFDKKVPNVSETTCSYSAHALQKIISLVLEEKRHPALIVLDLQNNERISALQDGLGYYGASIPDSTQPIPKHIQKNGTNINDLAPV